MSIQVAWDDWPPATHYHIQWSGNDTVDWERYATRSAAELGAKSLARPGEQYTIQEEGEDCARCASLVDVSAKSRTR